MAGKHGIAGLTKIEIRQIGSCEIAGQERVFNLVVFHLECPRFTVKLRQFYDVAREHNMLIAPPGDIKSVVKFVQKNFPEGFDYVVLIQQSEFQPFNRDIPDMEGIVILKNSSNVSSKRLEDEIFCGKQVGYILTSFS